MSDLDVALRLRLVNQLSAPAERAERDLKELRRAAEQIGRAGAGDGLARDIRNISDVSGRAERDVLDLRSAADRLGRARGADTLRSELDQVGGAARRAERDILDIRSAAQRVGRGSGIDDLRRDLEKAQREADDLRRKLERIDSRPHRRRTGAPGFGAGGAGTGLLIGGAIGAGSRDAVQEGWNRMGGDSVVTLGAGAGVAAGAAAGAAIIGGARSYQRYAGFDREMTLIGLTAEASDNEVERAKDQLRSLADDLSMPVRELVAALQALVETGLDLPGSLQRLRAVGTAAQASGASPSDMANTFFAVGNSLGIAPRDLSRASDVMVAGGQAGQFELRDMAQYLPSLLPMVAPRGWEGMEGLEKTVALLQVIRSKTGSASEAATSAQALFRGMDSNETTNRFGDFDVDIRQVLADARASGEDVVKVFLDTLMETIGGDLSKINRIATDFEFQRGLSAILSSPGQMESLVAGFGDAEGTTAANFARVADDAQAAIDRLGNAADRTATAVGELLDRLGLTTFLKDVTSTVNSAGGVAETYAEEGVAGATMGAWRRSWDRYMQAAGGLLFGDDYVSPLNRRQPARGAAGARSMEGVEGGRVAAEEAVARIRGQRLEQSLKPALENSAAESMQGFTRRLEAEGQKAEGVARSLADRIMSILSFDATPTISPRFSGPPARNPRLDPTGKAGASGEASGQEAPHAALGAPGASPVVHQHFHGGSDPLAVARRARLEQNREIRMAQARALHDTGRRA